VERGQGMFLLAMNKWSHDPELQIIHADVLLTIDGETLINEPLCIDVGLPALLLSAQQATQPNRWAPPEQWERMPFFVCGCGDPECRGFSFAVSHKDGNCISLIEVEERQHAAYRVVGEYAIPLADYREQVAQIGNRFLHFVQDLDYRPFYKDTVAMASSLLQQLNNLAKHK
jgi:hypothetical protein